MSDHLLARYYKHSLDAAAARNIARALRDSVDVIIEPGSPAGKRALRGVPVVGASTGVSPGTDPAQALFQKTCDCGRDKDPASQYCTQCYRAHLRPR
jgi:hypothetical protein